MPPDAIVAGVPAVVIGDATGTANRAERRADRSDIVIGVGVIGYGYWGPNLVRNFFETPGCRVVSVSDLQPERLAQRRAPRIRPSTRPPTTATCCSDPRVDAVAIATPVSTPLRAGACRRCEAGKHVLVEKPMTGDVEQAQRLIDEADAAQA